MRTEPLDAPHWDGRVLDVPARFGRRVALDLDGTWFCDIDADAQGRLRTELPFAPGGCRAFTPSVREGRDGALLWSADRNGAAAATFAFADHDDHALLLAVDALPMQAEVAIIVPVYNASAAVRRCLDSVLAQTTGRARLIVIDDASTDPAIAPLLARYAGLRGVELLANAGNLGFTATVNRGIALAGDADVVLLNADTVVGPNWLTGLRRAAHARDDIATATAVSDNAGAFSVPELERENPPPPAWSLEQVARGFWQHAGQTYPMLPTGNGFCMYVRRRTIDAIGVLDAEAFPQGYGEENDFCQRASANGLRHAIAGNVFVHHERSRSFGVARREALGRAGMQVLRERWPNYEADVGATLFSYERRVLDWRVRRLYALANAGHAPRPRILRVEGDRAAHGPAGAAHDTWIGVARAGTLEVTGSGRREATPPLRIALDATVVAHFLERHAIELVDLVDAAAAAPAALFADAARRLGIAVADSATVASSREAGYTVAFDSTRSFPDTPA